jgi:pSer/pThr/pTyr-binding forkhead associated (FHA) protein
MGKLIVMKGDNIIHEVPVSSTFTIGSALHCDLSLDLPDISKHHVQIIAQLDKASGKDVYRVRDLYSHNGTYLNDKPVSNDILRDQDVLSIGGCDLTFLFNTATPEATSL